MAGPQIKTVGILLEAKSRFIFRNLTLKKSLKIFIMYLMLDLL